MAIALMRPRFSTGYAAAAHAYALDLATAFFLFVSASVMSGRVWRFPFDDEVFTLDQVERLSGAEVLTFFLAGHDVHPPLATLLVAALYHLGLSEPAMRICSLAMTALALVLFHLLALTLIAQRDGQPVSLPSRLIAVLFFGLSALAISQGDALRWYPLFAMLIAVFAAFYLGGGNDAARLWSAVPLGLAASTNFVAVLVVVPFAIFRYGLQRQFRARFEAAYWLLFAVFASFGLISAYSLFVHHSAGVATQINNGVLRAFLTDALGFFGGHSGGLDGCRRIVDLDRRGWDHDRRPPADSRREGSRRDHV